MQELVCLSKPVPEGGRYMTRREAGILSAASGLTYGETSFIVPATDDGWTAFVAGCWNQRFILVDGKGDRGPGESVVPCLSGPVPAAGRYLSQYEVLRLRKAGVRCSPCTFIRMVDDGAGARRWHNCQWYPGFPLLVPAVPGVPGRRPVVPAGCCCWACAVEGCTVRRVPVGGTADGPGGSL